MYSNIIPFENVVDAVKDEIGSTNLRNAYPQIRRLIYRAERDIGFGYLLIKRIKYSIEEGTIFEGKARLPEDLIKLEALGTCEFGLCPGAYHHQGNYLFLCDDIKEFDLVYYTMLCDGNGNPAVSENHFEAVVAGVKYFMYSSKMWNNQGSASYYKELKLLYYDNCGEARGNDVMPTTKDEWSQIADILKMSYRDALIYSPKNNSYCCVPTAINNEVINPNTGTQTDDIVYQWQYSDLATDISDAPNIDQEFLDLQISVLVDVYLNGHVVSYNKIGRIAFAIQNISEDYYQILDVFNTDITTVVFDSYYNEDLKTQIYISKEYYSHGNIYFQLIKN